MSLALSVKFLHRFSFALLIETKVLRAAYVSLYFLVSDYLPASPCTIICTFWPSLKGLQVLSTPSLFQHTVWLFTTKLCANAVLSSAPSHHHSSPLSWTRLLRTLRSLRVAPSAKPSLTDTTPNPVSQASSAARSQLHTSFPLYFSLQAHIHFSHYLINICFPQKTVCLLRPKTVSIFVHLHICSAYLFLHILGF